MLWNRCPAALDCTISPKPPSILAFFPAHRRDGWPARLVLNCVREGRPTEFPAERADLARPITEGRAKAISLSQT